MLKETKFSCRKTARSPQYRGRLVGNDSFHRYMNSVYSIYMLSVNNATFNLQFLLFDRSIS